MDQFHGTSKTDAETSHARVHFEVNCDQLLQSQRSGVDVGGFLERREGRADAIAHCRFDFIRQERSQHQDRPAFPDAANGMGFGEIRHAEDVRPALHQERGDLFQAVPVGIGFDDG